jgi:hypothetical protein
MLLLFHLQNGVVSKCLMITLLNTANNTAMPYSLPHFSLLRPRKYGKQYGYSHTVAVFISEKRLNCRLFENLLANL